MNKEIVTITLTINRRTRKIDMRSECDRLETRQVIASVLAELDNDSRAVSVVTEPEAKSILGRLFKSAH